jgi:hypothetical protein
MFVLRNEVISYDELKLNFALYHQSEDQNNCEQLHSIHSVFSLERRFAIAKAE